MKALAMKRLRSTTYRASTSLLFFGAALVAGCAATTSPRPPVATASSATSTTNGEVAAPEPVVECDLVCERAQILSHPAESPDYNAQAVANANQVLEAIHGDLLACYKKRVAVNPKAHGFITVDIILEPDGHVGRVETTGGAVLGEGTMNCIVNRIKRASFEAVHGGGTQRIHVPFSLRRVAPDETM
jgi:hypothetical protein